MTLDPAAGPVPREWDARLYHRISDPMASWGAGVLARLPLRGDEVVMDAGCGSGRVTELLLKALPRGRVVAVDLSPAMLARARETLAAYGDRVRFVQADLVAVDRALDEPVDGIFSGATFHWIDDFPGLFGALFRALRPGGWLLAQCGGAGNLEHVIRLGNALAAEPPYAEALASLREWHHRATAAEAAEQLRAAGFEAVKTWLQPAPVSFPDREAFTTYLRSIVLGRQATLLGSERADAYARDLAEAVGRSGSGWVLDYVRLNLEARRPAASASA